MTPLTEEEMEKAESHVPQIGGNHYGTKYQHWDYCKDAKTGYFEGNATKYIYRWRSKAGIQDLEKALSFVLKLRIGNLFASGDRGAWRYKHLLTRFLDENLVGDPERTVITRIINWNVVEDLDKACEELREMIQQEQAVQAGKSYVSQG